jgi:BirA family biotin operon repressor/biotin-[acetyl-CoA-carboxylase] ligase
MRPLKDSPQKRKIVRLLRKNDIVSGEFIGRELGISRSAVWKHIEDLKELGYRIESTPSGYRLIYDPGIPYPWELDVESVYYPVTKSTMDDARRLAEKGSPSGLFVIAGEQIQGKGRRGRKWRSPPGGLYFSVILRPNIPMEKVNLVENSGLLAIERFMSHMGFKSSTHRRGIFIGEKKVGGILTEAYGEVDEVKFVIVGIGLNVNNPVPEGATSLSLELGGEIRLTDVARKLFSILIEELSWAVRN